MVSVFYVLSHGYVLFFFFKQKTAYELRISDWSSDVCSSDLVATLATIPGRFGHDNVIRYCSQAMGVPIELRCRRPCQILRPLFLGSLAGELEIGRASCRERVCQYV